MNAPTPAELADRLRELAVSKERFGRTAREVLETAALIAAAHSEWDKGTIAAFQEQEKIHVKVWGKLVAIARSENLSQLPENQLPTSYTALYALEVMTPGELKAAEADGLLKIEKLSSRAILDWTKAYRLRGTGVEQEMPLTLLLREDLSERQQQDLLAALSQVAEQFGAEVLQGKGGIKQVQVKADLRRTRAEELENLLLEEIQEVVLSAPDDLKSRFGIESALDLIGGSREQFTGFFQVLEGKEREVFWIKYGHAYCLKIARDFNRTPSRAERFQLKKRMEQIIERWGIEKGNPGLEQMAKEIQQTYLIS